jgi:allophycocyanin alpha subunit
MSIVTKIILQTDDQVRYLTPGELEQIDIFIKSSDRRLKLAQALTQSRVRIVKLAAVEVEFSSESDHFN